MVSETVSSVLAASLLALIAAPVPGTAAAQSFPGSIEESLVGDWDCEGTRTYITKWGSIERMGNGYLAGLYHAADGVFAIKWDEGEREDWSYELDGLAVIFTRADGQEQVCRPR